LAFSRHTPILIHDVNFDLSESLLDVVPDIQHCYHHDVILPKNFATKSLLLLILAAAATLGVAAPPTLPSVPTTVDTITPTELRMHLEFLASDELGGRYTLSPSFAIAARYLASRLEGYGFKGAGDKGSFLQSFELVSSKPDAAKMALELTLGGKTETFKFAEDFFAGQMTRNGEAQGKIVYVGAGLSAPELGHDDYAGADVKGKIVLAISELPAGIDASRIGPDQQGAAAAAAHGAAAILQVPPQRFLDIMTQRKSMLQAMASRESVQLSKADSKIPAIALGPDLAQKLFANMGTDLKSAMETARKKEAIRAKEQNISARLNVAIQQTRSPSQNVAGILEGTDPQLKNEYVTFSAHYDHLKTGANGEIYHGADDDGSGTSAVLAIARAMSLERPKRSVLVIFHAGEELGLLGSEYNTDVAPAVPLDKVVVDLNIDMIGRSKPAGDTDAKDEHLTDAHTVYLVGADRISPELNQLSEQTNSQFQKLKLDYYYNDPNNPERIYFRSDHWNYAKHGIPIIFYFDGTHVDYHRPTDTVDKIDFEKMTQVTRLVFETGWRIANLDHRLAKKP
jgi:Zn-dependent M28 family amino/carboxypeptidase